MRIATSTIYEQQIASIDDLTVAYQKYGKQLSTGKSLTQPEDDPLGIGQDINLTGTLGLQTGDVSNAVSAKNELTFTDSTLASLTDILQQARSITVGSATDVIPNGAQRKDQAKEIEGLLEHAIALANAQYGNKFVFAGTGPRSSPPVVAQGSPPTGKITFSGNLDQRTVLINGQNVVVGTTLQQGFNYQSSDGTPDIFQLLANLRDAMNKENVVDQSGIPVNAAGKTIYDGNSPPAVQTQLSQLTGGGGGVASLPLQADSTGQYSITLSATSSVTGQTVSNIFTFTNATLVSDQNGTGTTPPTRGSGTAASVIGQINAWATANNTGLFANFDVASQRISITSSNPLPNGGTQPFQITDTPSAGATNSANFTQTFAIQNQGDIINDLSTQIGDVDRVLNNVLKSRAEVGQRIQNLDSTASQVQGQITDNNSIQSGLEDTNVAQATSRFTQTQTALQAAYAVTSRIESKTLIDYL